SCRFTFRITIWFAGTSTGRDAADPPILLNVAVGAGGSVARSAIVLSNAAFVPPSCVTAATGSLASLCVSTFPVQAERSRRERRKGRMGLAASTFWREDFSDNERASPIRVETRVGRPDRGILQAAHGKHGYI